MATRRNSDNSFEISKRDSLKNINKVQLKTGVSLEGDELEDYCRKRGLCPLCARTRTRKRLFKFFKKNKWEALTVTNKAGDYVVYKGYCVKQGCFTLDQAKSLAGDRPPTLQRKKSRQRSVMKGLSDNSSLNDIEDSESLGHAATHKRSHR